MLLSFPLLVALLTLTTIWLCFSLFAEPLIYTVLPCTADDFSFDLPLAQPVLIPHHMLAELCTGDLLLHLHLPTDQTLTADTVIAYTQAAYHPRITRAISPLFDGRFGASEDAGHSRNDCLFKLIAHTSGLSFERSTITVSTVAGNCCRRPDVRVNPVPVVLSEEKADATAAARQANRSAVTDKFLFGPLYRRVPFIVIVEIAGDEVTVSRLHREQQVTHSSVFDLANSQGIIACLRACINVGRYAKWAASMLMESITPIAYNQTRVKPANPNSGLVWGSELTITYTAVTKVYIGMPGTDVRRYVSLLLLPVLVSCHHFVC